jgi:hypothetical protein
MRLTAKQSLAVMAVCFAPFCMGASNYGVGCSNTNDRQSQAQEQILAQGNDAVGMPSITHFAAKRSLKRTYELADQSVPTITYMFDLNGHLHKLCDSISYPIPYSTEYTSPDKEGHGQGTVVAQADPDTLFHSPSSDGTWVLCLKPGTREVWPVYVEPKVTASPFPLPGVVE